MKNSKLKLNLKKMTISSLSKEHEVKILGGIISENCANYNSYPICVSTIPCLKTKNRQANCNQF